MIVTQEIIDKIKQFSKYENDHWIFIGALTRGNYGNLRIGDKVYQTHRLSAAFYLNLDLEDTNSLACHKDICNIRACWNPNHLYVGTHSSNLQDNMKAGITAFGGKYQREKTHCPRGHEYSEANTSRDKQGYRKCKQCKNEKRRNKKVNEV